MHEICFSLELRKPWWRFQHMHRATTCNYNHQEKDVQQISWWFVSKIDVRRACSLECASCLSDANSETTPVHLLILLCQI